MTDKEKIRAEIKRLRKKNYEDADNGCDEDQCYGYDCCLDDLRKFIDSLPEEPVRKVWHEASEVPEPDRKIVFEDKTWLGKYNGGAWMNRSRWAYRSDLLKVDGIPCKNEPVSEDLEKQAHKEFEDVLEVTCDTQCAQIAYDEFKAGAQWMAKQGFSRELKIKVDGGGYPYINELEMYDYDKDEPLFKDGEEVIVQIRRKDGQDSEH